ncbi:MAG: hypothetical protein K2G55_20505 [Lachnospiraceae bacterium]|nr:hypothetical protein [Lachnospiraceae bacterium]MDE7200852.1 hypothetical protein [Lachnospiraceae bacterium]
MEQGFGKQIFAHIDQHRAAENSDSMRLQSEESALKLQYRKLTAKGSCDDEALYKVFRKLIEIRCELADSLGYNSCMVRPYKSDHAAKEEVNLIWNYWKPFLCRIHFSETQ